MNPSHDLVELTRTLVAFDTINPPGNERPCAKHLGCLMEDGGFSVSYHEFAEQRTSLVARIVGSSDRRILSPCVSPDISTQCPWVPRRGRSIPLRVRFRVEDSTVIEWGWKDEPSK